MRPPVLLALLASSACGRAGFDPIGARVDAVSLDQAVDAEVDGPGSGLLLHLAFEADGVSFDRAPAHHATSCVMCPSSTAGRVGAGAGSFDGVQCITIADQPDLHPLTFTFALWLNYSISQRTTAFGRPFNGASDTTNTFEMWFDSFDRWYVGVNSVFTDNGPISRATWHHIAGVFDGTTITEYVDGAAVASLVTGPAMYAADALHIGCDTNLGNLEEFVMGQIDDVRLYDHALDATEVGALAAM